MLTLRLEVYMLWTANLPCRGRNLSLIRHVIMSEDSLSTIFGGILRLKKLFYGNLRH